MNNSVLFTLQSVSPSGKQSNSLVETPKKVKNLFDLDGMDLTRNSYGVPLSFEDGDFSEFMDFTDVLFSSLMSAPQPFAFPNPREIDDP
ncbi:hypothetical protein E2C01_028504 [Portunus trituberculatus]|uniref:Uncharacterized protein n=1 Tax=Portunus trituberculatus TaxID=210409 RepID=A0A5B7EP76_PORTR|nr:hypothetical protein [Portunus trituberculatus]